MKTLPAAVLSAVVAALVTFAVVSSNAPQLPPTEYEDGFSFDIPCAEHGVHTQVVTGNRLVRVYEISVEGEVQGEVSAEQIVNVLEMIKFMQGLQPVPNDQEESR